MKFSLLVLFLLLSGCSAAHNIGSGIACSNSKSDHNFPPDGKKYYINLALNLSDKDQKISYSDQIICTYNGSICGGGAWFDIWREDKKQWKEWPLSTGNTLVLNYNSFCYTALEHIEKCKSGTCNPQEDFQLLVKFPGGLKKLPAPITVKQDGMTVTKFYEDDRKSVQINKLSDYQLSVNSFELTFSE